MCVNLSRIRIGSLPIVVYAVIFTTNVSAVASVVVVVAVEIFVLALFVVCLAVSTKRL